jgi:2-polyprenyl-6-methoxyphenol hydroxylase-like FAD-dependent oxidoreductase
MDPIGVDVLVVGGGLGGLVLAEVLGRRGKRVMVVARNVAPPAWTHPEILWPATVDLLFSLVPRHRWEAEAMVPLEAIEFFTDGKRSAPWPNSVLERSGIQPWSTDPNATRELLYRSPSFEARRGMEVVELLKENGRISGVRALDLRTGATSETLAEWTIGDDGAESRVRSACGIELNARSFPLDFLCFEPNWPKSVAPRVGCAWLNPRAMESGILALGIAPIPNGKGAGMVVVHARDFDENPAHEASWDRFCAIDPAIGSVVGERRFPADFVRIRRSFGHAARYGAPGALIMGDAAHPTSPIGTQGANMSIADGRVIADLIAGGCSDLIVEFERRRRPANRRSLIPTRMADVLLGLPGWSRSATLAFGLIDLLQRRPAMLENRIKVLSTAFLENESRAASRYAPFRWRRRSGLSRAP